VLSMPIGLEVRIDLAFDDENAGRPFAHPCAERIKIGQRSDRRGAGSLAARNGGKIRIREPDDVGFISLAPKVMHLGGVGAVVVDEHAKPQLQAQRGFEIRNRHHEAAIACTEHGELAGLATARPMARRRCPLRVRTTSYLMRSNMLT
jgi:hypothetical protein